MSRIEVQPVTAANWRACAALSVRLDQARFVAPVTYYLWLCAARALHRSLGFVETGETEDDGAQVAARRPFAQRGRR